MNRPINRYLLDSNILIYYINQQLPLDIKNWLDECLMLGCSLSIISRIEVLG